MQEANILIIGAGGGIGSATARRLQQQGAHPILAGRTRDSLEPLATELSAPLHIVDASEVSAVETLCESIVEEHGQLDGVINCAGSILLKPAHLTSLDEFEATVKQNLYTAFAAVKGAAKAMMKTGGSVVLMSTAAARAGLSNHEAIAAAKGGVQSLALSAAATYANRGIRFNVVAPGLVETPLAERITKNEASRKASESMHPLGRLGTPDDIASAICWLVDPAQSWVTGQILGVDGGLATVRPRG